MLVHLSKYVTAFSSLPVFGGSSLASQKRDLDKIPDLIVATPGRLIDHLQNTKGFTLEDIDCLVLDEADRLIEMGFKDDVMRIIKQCTNPKRQTIMVSATLNQDLKELATIALKKPIMLTVNQQQKKADITNLKLTQYLVRLKLDDVQKIKRTKKPSKPKKKSREDSDFDSEVDYGSEDDAASESSGKMDDGTTKLEDEVLSSDSESSQEEEPEEIDDNYRCDTFLVRREATLLTLVKRGFHKRVIVFFNEKKQCQRAHILFAVFGLKAAQIHGNMSQTERMESIEKF